MRLIVILLFGAALFAQNPRSVISTHPRLIVNSNIADTWEPAKNRLEALRGRLLSGGAAASDFTSFRATIASVGSNYGALNNLQTFDHIVSKAFASLILADSDPTQSDTYASELWTNFITKNGNKAIDGATTVVSGGVAEVTFPIAHPWTVGQTVYFWGASDDRLNGGKVLTVTSTYTVRYSTTATAGTYTGIVANKGWWTGASGTDDLVFYNMAAAYVYDWCYDWLVRNGHDAEMRANLKAAYYAATPQHASSQFSSRVREGDYHNYTVAYLSAVMQIGLALWGDDALGATILDEGAGYFWEGQTVPNPQGFTTLTETFTYNLKTSTDVLTGGAMNWEGSRYWRSALPEMLMALEAYDSATSRTNDIWNTQFSTSAEAGFYKIYTIRPDGNQSQAGDAAPWDVTSGKDNITMVMLLDRWQDGHFKYFIANTAADNWNDGANSLGKMWKLIFWPYVNGPAAAANTDLPKTRRFGPDIFIRSGWNSTDDTYIAIQTGIPGVYHRNYTGGHFDLYAKGKDFLSSPPYIISSSDYFTYQKRSIGSNVPLIYKTGDCWYEKTSTSCGVNADGSPVFNDGGQRITHRRQTTAFPNDANKLQIDRLWSGTLFADPTYGTRYTQHDPIPTTKVKTSASYSYVGLDLSGLYANDYSDAGGLYPSRRTSKVTRDFVYFPGSQDYLVVFDRVTASNASYQKRFPFHTIEKADVNTGSWVAPSAGITTYTGGPSAIRTDNGTSRLFGAPLLPSSASVRVVGGSSCVSQPVVSTTIATQGILEITGHGLSNGEWVGFTGFVGGSWTKLNDDTDTNNPYYYVEVVDANHIKLRDITGGTYWNNSTWGAWTTAGTLRYHSSCGWQAYVDDTGLGSSFNYFYPNLNSREQAKVPKWRFEVLPGSAATDDVHMTVFQPSTTATENPIQSTLLTGTGLHGAQIEDPTLPSIAIFPASDAGVTSMSITTSHSGTGRYVATGLATGTYNVAMSGTPVSGSPFTVTTDGSLAFTSTAGALTISQNTAISIYATPSPLNFSCTLANTTSGPQTLTIGADNIIDNWTASKTQAWLSLSASSGVAAGTTSVSVNCTGLTAGAHSDTITISSSTTNVGNSPITVPVNLTAYAAMAVTSSTLPHGVKTRAYSQSLSSVGGQAPVTWAVTSGSLCSGISLSSAGVLSGTPSAAGSCSFTVTATDALSATATKALTLVVDNISTPGHRTGGKTGIGGRVRIP